jgi:hypothetical protein
MQDLTENIEDSVKKVIVEDAKTSKTEVEEATTGVVVEMAEGVLKTEGEADKVADNAKVTGKDVEKSSRKGQNKLVEILRKGWFVWTLMMIAVGGQYLYYSGGFVGKYQDIIGVEPMKNYFLWFIVPVIAFSMAFVISASTTLIMHKSAGARFFAYVAAFLVVIKIIMETVTLVNMEFKSAVISALLNVYFIVLALLNITGNDKDQVEKPEEMAD